MKISSILQEIWLHRFAIFFYSMASACLLLEWGSSTRIGLLPRYIAWLPDILLAIAVLWMLFSISWGNIRISFFTSLDRPLLLIILLGIVSAIINHQPILNFLFGIWLYFRFWIWFYFILWMGKRFNLAIHFTWVIIAITFLQIPLTVIQKFALGLDRDFVSGTIVGTQRLALVLLVGLVIYLTWVLMIKRKPGWSFLIILLVIPSALGESKFMFFVFPFLLLIILFSLYRWEYISFKIGTVLFVISLLCNVGAIFLYPVNAQQAITSAISDPKKLFTLQDRISNGEKNISQSAYDDPEEMLFLSKDKDLGRTAAFRFAFNNIDKLAQGGLFWGGGLGSTSSGSTSFMNGSIQKAYPSFGFSRTLIVPFFLELGLLGLLGIGWLAIEIFMTSFQLMRRESSNAKQTGLLGLMLVFVVLTGAIYTNLIASQSFMFTLMSGLAVVMMSRDSFNNV